MSLLRVESVSKAFGSLAAVRNVSLAVEPGELFAVIGPNGAGKTTLFNMISGMFQPSQGRIIFRDVDITALSPERRVSAGMARTFQITEIFPELSVRDNIRIAVEVASGYRLRPWLSRSRAIEVETRVEEIVAFGRTSVGGTEIPDEARIGVQLPDNLVDARVQIDGIFERRNGLRGQRAEVAFPI